MKMGKLIRNHMMSLVFICITQILFNDYEVLCFMDIKSFYKCRDGSLKKSQMVLQEFY